MTTRQLRIGDAERDTAIAALSRHFSDGRLTAQEHEERVELAINARTDADLWALFADLPRLDDPAARRRPDLRLRRPMRLLPIVVLAIVAPVILFHACPVIAIVALLFFVTRSGIRRGW
jgi:hypothetical protein